jgi:hypothetical protein
MLLILAIFVNAIIICSIIVPMDLNIFEIILLSLLFSMLCVKQHQLMSCGDLWSYHVTFYSSLTDQSYARQLPLLAIWITHFGVYSVLITNNFVITSLIGRLKIWPLSKSYIESRNIYIYNRHDIIIRLCADGIRPSWFERKIVWPIY